MSTKKGEITYRRPKLGYEEHDPENWEDFIVCEAYDKAVNNVNGPIKTSAPVYYMKNHEGEGNKKSNDRVGSKVDATTGTNPTRNTNAVWSKQTNSKAQREDATKNFDSSKNHSLSWKQGDKCVAVYSEDGLYYDCEILSINHKSGTCVVEYEGYGNRETIDVADLHSKNEWKTRDSSTAIKSTTSVSSSYASTSSLSSTDGTSSDVTQDIYKGRASKKKKSDETKQGRRSGPNFENLRSMAPPNFNINPLFAMPPPMFMPHGFPPPAVPRGAAGFTTEDSGSRLSDLTDDALSSMLMSWYMAGYHTGYYQGISSRGGRKNKRK